MLETSRKAVALRYKGKGRGAPAPSFRPDFTSDSEMYKEIGGLNEISIAQSQHSLNGIAQYRLQARQGVNAPTGLSDDVLFDNIFPKSYTTNEILCYMRRLESDWKKEQVKDD